MNNLTITIWPTFNGNDPEGYAVGQTPINDRDKKNPGIGTSPPDK